MTTLDNVLKIEMTHHHVRLSVKQEEYVREKIDHLRKYAARMSDESTHCRVDFRKNKLKSKGASILCEVTIFVPQAKVRAEVSASKVEEAVDLCIDKLKRQINRYKSRWNNWDKKQEKWVRDQKEKQFSEEAFSPDVFGAVPKVSKRKHCSPVQSMSESEAIEQMELLAHDFFFFLNSETDRYCVVYKRADETYGLIEPHSDS